MSEPTVQATIASPRGYGLAEGPLWDAPRERLVWVDINAGDVHAGTLSADATIVDTTTLHRGNETVGVAALGDHGQLLIAGARSIIAPDGQVPLIADDKPSRLNDGACDPAGRFLVGSMALDDRTGEECLYRLERDGTVTVIDDGLTISNGLAWSPDGATFYSVDTAPGIVYARPYDPASGTCGERRVLLELDSPDGLTVDGNGNLWIALHGAGQIVCHAPGGERLRTVAVENPFTSSVTFAGRDLRTLVITSASRDERTPTGHLYTATVGVRGLPATPWAGIHGA